MTESTEAVPKSWPSQRGLGRLASEVDSKLRAKIDTVGDVGEHLWSAGGVWFQCFTFQASLK